MNIESRCHIYAGPSFEPEELSPAWYRANYRPNINESLNNDRPGAVPHGARPIHEAKPTADQEPQFLSRRRVVHWIDGRCGIALHKLNYPAHVLAGYEFAKMEPGRCCKKCLTQYQNG
jgi:hypothetical protein